MTRAEKDAVKDNLDQAHNAAETSARRAYADTEGMTQDGLERSLALLSSAFDTMREAVEAAPLTEA